jgi:hypothetical protein
MSACMRRGSRGDVVDWRSHPGFALIAVKSGTMTLTARTAPHLSWVRDRRWRSPGGTTKAANEGRPGRNPPFRNRPGAAFP